MVTTRWRNELYRSGSGRPAAPSRSRRPRAAWGRMAGKDDIGRPPEGSC